MLLIIDNYDSFVHNLARYCTIAGWVNTIVRNDKISVQQIEKINPEAILISPGPGTPDQAGIAIELIQKLGHKIPILGVCLGHQAIANAYGGFTAKGNPVHGRSSDITHNGKHIFKNMQRSIAVGRYHSLIVGGLDKTELFVDARTKDGEIMAISHQSFPVYGIQFHPESILTPQGMKLLQNFKSVAQEWNKLIKPNQNVQSKTHASA